MNNYVTLVVQEMETDKDEEGEKKKKGTEFYLFL